MRKFAIALAMLMALGVVGDASAQRWRRTTTKRTVVVRPPIRHYVPRTPQRWIPRYRYVPRQRGLSIDVGRLFQLRINR